MPQHTAPTRAHRAVGAVDLAAVALLLACAVVGFGPSFAGPGYLRAAVGGALVGLALAFLGARFRWSVLTLAAATLGAYFLFGGALALPGTAIAGVVPTLETLQALALGAVTSWKGLLTVTPPVDAFLELLVVPYLSTLVAAVLSGSLALRARRPAWALLPAAVLLIGVILLGTAETVQPLVQGIVFGVVALTWTAWRRAGARADALRSTSGGGELDRPEAGRLRARRVRNAAAMLGAAALVTAFAAPVLSPATHRHVLRDVVEPPLDLNEYPSPLVGFRKYVKDLEEEVLFTVTGLPDDGRLRLATLDAYTGTVIDVAGGSPGGPTGSGSFGRVGESIPAPSDAAPTDGTAEVTVEVAEYRGVWVPALGRPTEVRFVGSRAADLQGSLYLNPESGVVLSTEGLAEGDRYTVAADLLADPSDDELARLPFASLQLPGSLSVPQSVGSLAETFTSDASGGAERVAALASDLAAGGVFSNGLDGEPPSRAGHGSDRIDTLLTGREMVGDDEQFAVAMTLMARSLGIPARVVMGFYPGEDTPKDGDTYSIRGTDVHAWVEVAYQDEGAVRWVAYEPTPDEDQPPQDQDPRSQSEPEPQVLQEPPPPEEPAEAPLQPIPEAAEDETTDQEGIPWGQYLRYVVVVGVPLALVLAPFVLIALAKARRRKRRLAASAPVDRVSGGWREVVDTAVDLGAPVLASATRRETARDLEERYPEAGAVVVAERADAAVFGAGEPSDAEVTAFWAEVDRLVSDMSRSVGRWQRLRGRFSPRSLTRGIRPVPTRRGGHP